MLGVREAFWRKGREGPEIRSVLRVLAVVYSTPALSLGRRGATVGAEDGHEASGQRCHIVDKS